LQEIIEAMILKSLSKDASKEEFLAYIKGMSDCLTIVETSVSDSKRVMAEGETDPLYIFTWNDVIRDLSKVILQELRKGINLLSEDIKDE